ncbi:rhomboid family intramembrane serine protease [Halorarius litoreus]|uniref:rhomboid family intramembrane serine protease n=1 Tax=Halorarius litoreus TaxID=2962676 RepID=UPI0020CCC5DD|nr:rhomboid family intramembrane serine protease [Halorarius litoreus]
MAKCDVCGKHIDLPYNCRGCGGTYCGDHRLPENHSCAGLDSWNDPKSVFDSGFDDSVTQTGRSGGVLGRVTPDTGAGGPLSYFRGNLSYVFLAVIVLTYVAQLLVANLAPELFRPLFVLTSAHPEYVWTWVTSVFSHGSPGHLFGNAIVLFFFGPVLERKLGSKRFGALFIGAGMIAGLSQIAAGYLLGDPVSGVLGASGGIMAVLAVLSVLNPDLKVYLYFILPIPIWVLTIGYAALSVFGVLADFSVLGGNVAHAAHLMGLFIGAAYGFYIEDKVSAPGELRFGGGRGGMGGPGRGRF